MLAQGMPHISQLRKDRLNQFGKYASILPWFNIDILHKLFLNVFLHYEYDKSYDNYHERSITCADLLCSPMCMRLNHNVFCFYPEHQGQLQIELKEKKNVLKRIGMFMVSYTVECREKFLSPRYVESFRVAGNLIIDL